MIKDKVERRKVQGVRQKEKGQRIEEIGKRK
jgi:hypothetical protein